MGSELKRIEAEYGGRGVIRHGPSDAGSGFTVAIADDLLTVTSRGGFRLAVAVRDIQSFHPDPREGVAEVEIRMEAHPVDDDHTLVLTFAVDPGPDRDAVLRQWEELRDRVDGVSPAPPGSPDSRVAEESDVDVPIDEPRRERMSAASPTPPPPPVKPPFQPIKGPDLRAGPEGEEWIMLPPLPDTVSLAEGVLFVPEEPTG